MLNKSLEHGVRNTMHIKGGSTYIYNCYVVLHMTCTTAYEMKLNDAVDGIPQQNVRTQSIRKHKR